MVNILSFLILFCLGRTFSTLISYRKLNLPGENIDVGISIVCIISVFYLLVIIRT